MDRSIQSQWRARGLARDKLPFFLLCPLGFLSLSLSPAILRPIDLRLLVASRRSLSRRFRPRLPVSVVRRRSPHGGCHGHACRGHGSPPRPAAGQEGEDAAGGVAAAAAGQEEGERFYKGQEGRQGRRPSGEPEGWLPRFEEQVPWFAFATPSSAGGPPGGGRGVVKGGQGVPQEEQSQPSAVPRPPSLSTSEVPSSRAV